MMKYVKDTLFFNVIYIKKFYLIENKKQYLKESIKDPYVQTMRDSTTWLFYSTRSKTKDSEKEYDF